MIFDEYEMLITFEGKYRTGHLLALFLYIIGEYATKQQIDILKFYDQCKRFGIKDLNEEARIELILTIFKVFFKCCAEKNISTLKSKVLEVINWCILEIGNTVEVFELLNFYCGIINNIDETNYNEYIEVINTALTKELTSLDVFVIHFLF